LAKGKALAAEFESRVSAAYLDVLDAHSLDDFCSRCSIIVNCAGPTAVLQDRVAQAAFHRRCHYIDPGGFSLVKQRLLPHSREIADSGLSFVLSAGWLPGVSEVVPVYADAQARAKMDALESVAVYCGDSSEWSVAALRDGVWYVRHLGPRSPGYFRKGEWVRARATEAYPKVDLGSLGLRRFCMLPTAEQNEVGRRLNACDFFAYSHLAGFPAVFSGVVLALLPLPEAFGVRLIRNVFRGHLPVGGFVVARAVGRSQGRTFSLTVQAVYDHQRQYWANGLVPAIVARMLWRGEGVMAGIHFLADAVDPMVFMAELRKAGVEVTEKFE
jgi:hypothetical protein